MLHRQIPEVCRAMSVSQSREPPASHALQTPSVRSSCMKRGRRSETQPYLHIGTSMNRHMPRVPQKLQVSSLHSHVLTGSPPHTSSKTYVLQSSQTSRVMWQSKHSNVNVKTHLEQIWIPHPGQFAVLD